METRSQTRLLALLAVGFLVSVALCAQVPPEQRTTRFSVAKGKQAEKTASSLYRSLAASVVTVSALNSNKDKLASGSGIVISRTGDILTNYHVVEGGNVFEVTPGRGDTTKPFLARAVRCSPELDLAVIHPQSDHELKPVGLSPSLPAVGDRVYALGSPLELQSTISEGIVSQIRDSESPVLIQTTAAISPGSSGGGLFNADGLLIGVTSYSIVGGQALNFAVSALSLRDLRTCDSFPLRLTSPPTEQAAAKEVCPLVQNLIGAVVAIAENDKTAHLQYQRDLDSYTTTILELTRRMRDAGRIIQPPPGPSLNAYHFNCLSKIKGLSNDLTAGHFDPIPERIRQPIYLAVGDLASSYDTMVTALSRDPRLSDNLRAAQEAIGREWATLHALLSSLRSLYPQVHDLCPKININFNLSD